MRKDVNFESASLSQQICDKIQNRGWTVVKDEEGRMGPYAYHDDQWVGFDDQETIKRKVINLLKIIVGL